MGMASRTYLGIQNAIKERQLEMEQRGSNHTKWLCQGIDGEKLKEHRKADGDMKRESTRIKINLLSLPLLRSTSPSLRFVTIQKRWI